MDDAIAPTLEIALSVSSPCPAPFNTSNHMRVIKPSCDVLKLTLPGITTIGKDQLTVRDSRKAIKPIPLTSEKLSAIAGK